MVDIDSYQKSYDHVAGAWKKKAEATAFADFLAPELGINRKGVVVDKDGKFHRVHIPILQMYWNAENPCMWAVHLVELKNRKKSIWEG